MSDFRKVMILRVFTTIFIMAFLAIGGIVFLNLSKSSVIKSYSSEIVNDYKNRDLCNQIEKNTANYFVYVKELSEKTQKNERTECKIKIHNLEKEIQSDNENLLVRFNGEEDYLELNANLRNFFYYGNEIIHNLDSKTVNTDNLEYSIFELTYYGSLIKDCVSILSQQLNEKCYRNQIKMDNYLHDFDSTTICFLMIIVLITCVCIVLCIKSVNEIAERDIMTGLLNQDGIIQQGVKLSLLGKLEEYDGLYINIKDFKYLNRQVGSAQGDKILMNYSKKISQYVGKNGYCARLSGDIFGVLILKSETDSFLYYISTICENVYINSEMQKIFIRSRSGIYGIKKGDSMNDVINCSMIAYNEAKIQKTPEYLWFDSSMMEKVMNEKETLVSFPRALEGNEFIVYYQPKVNLADNTLNGCEALVRWMKGDYCINPNEFIPVLEKEGTVTELDFYVFEQVCKDLRHWIDRGLNPVKVSSNFSKKHLHNAHLAEDILRIMIKYNIDCKYIEIELTESSAYEDFEVLDTFVKQMRMAGISVSIDDFGTGYSSLTLLKDLDVNVIKLDKSFINHINEDNELDEIMISNTVHMIHDLNRKVICEGVETKKQADFLKSVNCLSVQGYLYDKPLSSADFEERLKCPKYAV